VRSGAQGADDARLLRLQSQARARNMTGMISVRIAIRLAFVAILALLALFAWENRDALVQRIALPVSAPANSKAAFDRWLAQEPERAQAFARFEAFLAQEDVAAVVEPWQLARIDAFFARECEVEPFLIPPEESWPNVVPALRLVRDEVVPAVEPVQVLSSYRTPELNVCAGGAGRSNHLDFSAVDLATSPRRGGEQLYRELCAMHADAGPPSRMGLGAYYDMGEGDYSGGRFHIDAQGYRTWGRSYSSASSPCGRFD